MDTQKKIKRLKSKADKLFHILVCKKYPKCLPCGINDSVCAHHFILKSKSSELRYDLLNGVPICNSCHCKIHMAQDPEIENRIIQKRGQDWADRLYKIKNSVIKKYRGVVYYKNVINNLEEEIKKLN